APRFRTDEFRILLIVLEQLVGERGELEVVILFADCLGDTSAIGAGVTRLSGINVGFVVNAVLARVGPLVDESFFLQTLPQFLRALLVPRFGGTDEIVVADSHLLKKRA